MLNDMNDLFLLGLTALLHSFVSAIITIIKLGLCVDLWMCEITYLFAYAISATAAMTDLAKYETKQRANAQMN